MKFIKLDSGQYWKVYNIPLFTCLYHGSNEKPQLNKAEKLPLIDICNTFNWLWQLMTWIIVPLLFVVSWYVCIHMHVTNSDRNIFIPHFSGGRKKTCTNIVSSAVCRVMNWSIMGKDSTIMWPTSTACGPIFTTLSTWQTPISMTTLH